MSNGSGGIGKKIDSENETITRITTAHSLVANPVSQADRVCRRSSMRRAGTAVRFHLYLKLVCMVVDVGTGDILGGADVFGGTAEA